MKLKAPPGVGDPCVAGVAIASRDGVYEVEPAVGALLVECFGFVELQPDATATPKVEVAAPATAAAPKVAAAPRRGKPAARKA